MRLRQAKRTCFAQRSICFLVTMGCSFRSQGWWIAAYTMSMCCWSSWMASSTIWL